RVARQRDAADIAGADGGEQARLLAVGGRHAPARYPVPGEIRLDELDQRDVGLRAGGVECDEPRQQLLRGAERWAHEVLQLRLRLACGLSSEKAGMATLNCSPSSVVIR